MIKIIDEILIASGCSIQYCSLDLYGGGGFFVYSREHENSNLLSYFIVKDIGDVEAEFFLNSRQIEIYENLSEFFSQNEASEKNSILILLRQDERDELLANSFVSTLEEDRFFFKKQVILYSSNEKNVLQKELENSSSKINFASIIYDKDRFKKFSTENNDPLYSILVKLYTKIPSLTIEGDNYKYLDLSEIISNRLREKNLYNSNLEMLLLGNDDEAIKKWISKLLEDTNV